jgi:hypothetical protein
LEISGVVANGQKRQQQMKSLLAFPIETTQPLAEAVGPSGFKIRAAESWGDRSSASFLVNRLYSTRGYKTSRFSGEDDPSRMTLLATDHQNVVGTLTIGFDCDRRLLVDELFPEAVDSLRDAGRDVCEFTKLAVDGLVRSQRALAAMFHVAFIHAHRIQGCDNLLIEVNPRHVRYYEAKLGFKVFGPERLNRRVNAPAVLMSLDLWYAQEQVGKFGGKPELSATERTLYPFGFSANEEAGIVGRLRRQHGGTLQFMAAGG